MPVVVLAFLTDSDVVAQILRPSSLGELDEELVEKFGDDAVDELRAVVGVEADDLEGMLLNEAFQERDEVVSLIRSTQPTISNWVTSSSQSRQGIS